MKKIILFFILTVSFFSNALFANNSKSLNLSFSDNQFLFSFNSQNLLEILRNDRSLVVDYDSDTSAPGLPLVSVNVTMPKGIIMDSFNYSSIKRNIFNDVLISPNPKMLPTNDNVTPLDNVKNPHYSMERYPSESVKYMMATSFGDSTIFHFLVCPFEYDTKSRKLYLLESININVAFRPSTSSKMSVKETVSKMLVKKQFCFDGTSYAQSTIQDDLLSNKDSVDYIIITSKELSYYFQQLAIWKKKKGIRTIIETVENIKEYDKGSGRSLQDKIKAYLLYMYHVKGIKFKYLLLGGDEDIIPSKKCYVEASGYKEKIPADIYYGCLGYDTDPFWDASGDGICGNIDDRIDLSQDVFVTRLPISTSTDVKNVLMKILEYEQNPISKGWNNSILTCGAKLGRIHPNGHSDAEIEGDSIYSRGIQPYWNGERKKIYDTYSDFEDEDIITFNSQNLQTILSKGFAFVAMSTHGNTKSWSTSGSSYTSSLASSLESPQYSVIATTACLTNAFDKDDPCLSEAFIRNLNSGVVAYFGSSRFGWYSPGSFDSSGPSAQYEEEFFKSLFDGNIKDKNFGKVVAYTKIQKLNSSSYNGCSRWLMFSINPIGDAEMPLYTENPKEFSACNVKLGLDGSTIIDTGVDSCNICIMSSADAGDSYYKVYKNVNRVKLKTLADDFSICVTKQNYIPKVYEMKGYSIKGHDKITFGKIEPDSGNLLVGVQVDSNANTISLMLSSVNGNREKVYTLSKEKTSIAENVSTLKNGIYVVSLCVDGKVVDSVQLIKK